MSDNKAIVIEARPYGPESTEDEIHALKSLVTSPTTNVIMYREPPVVTLFTLDLFWERIRELAADLDYYFILADLTGTVPPSAEARQHVRELYETISPSYVAVATGQSRILNIAAKFVLRRVLGQHRFSVYRDVDGALQHLEKLRREAATKVSIESGAR